MRLDGIQKKTGVSLVTVLLFMLVATIAATATYKWLTSEGRSSGARLQKQSAYQSAMAGLESARSWMTYNANDVGALIKQYKDNGKKVKLNSRLTPWSRADLNYDVWLVGVNTGAAHNFKLKVLSSGRSNGGAVHNEIAIFNVDGLYQVQIPEEETEGTNFDKAFDGKMTGITGNDTLQSGIIHGDFRDQNNTPKLSGNFVVSGDMGFGGTVNGNGDMYVKGSITSKNGGYTFGNDLKSTWGWMVTDVPDTNVVYVGGDVDCADNQPITVYGDLYVGGSIKERCAIHVTGNLTIGGSIERTITATKEFTIGKNLVFKKDAVFHYTTDIEYGTDANGSGSGVGVNTYLANLEGKSSNGGRKVNLGQKIYLYDNVTGYVHCRNRNNPSVYYRPTNCTYCEGFFTTCDGNEMYSKEDDRYFSIKHPLGFYGHFGSSYVVDNPKISEWSKNDGVLKDVSDNYWKNIAKMEEYGKVIKNDGTIPQAMLLKDSLSWIAKAKANVANCKMEVGWKTEPAHIKKLNDCYRDAQTNHPEWLYGGFLPIEWQYAEDKDPGEERLNGKFLIYASKAVGNTTLPATTATGIVMFYFEKGVNGQLKGKHDDNRHRDWVYNYFFYSNGDIKEIHGFNIKGSIVMSNGTTMQKYQGGNKVEFSSMVINALVAAGIIKENPEFTRLVNGESGSSGSGSSSTSVAGTADSYFIGASPQLRITLESQYENNEPLPTGEDEDDISSSFLVLPRVIYLPQNPYGRLSDYFNVVSLNGANVVKDAAKVTDCADIPKTDLLRSVDGGLTAGLHVCKYSDLDQTVPFYIYVSEEEIGNSPWVQFDDDYQDMGPSTTDYVRLKCPVETNGGEFTIRVSKPNDLPASWSITPAMAAEGTCDAASPSCEFKLHFNDADCGSAKSLFEVKTNNASEGTAVFQLTCVNGCLTGTPSTEKFVVSSSVTINRMNLSDYCALADVTCSDDLVKTAASPDCQADDTKSWVKAVGVSGSATNNCAISETNSSWVCGVSSAIELQKVDDGVPTGCEVFIPADATHNKVSNPVTDETYTLYASLKAKSVDFHLVFKGDNLVGKQIEVNSSRFDSPQTCSYTSPDTECTYTLYAGDQITLTVPTSDRPDFSYWKCVSGTNCESSEAVTGATYTIEAVNGENTVEVWFGQKDKHCFFDEFKTSKVCSQHTDVGDKMYCVSYCTRAGGEGCSIADVAQNAKWFVFGGQNERDNLLQYEGGKVWLKDTYTRGKKQSDVKSLLILSTLKAGIYGTLRAQFQVPRLGKGDDESTARVNKSGFLLRSNNDASSYMMLNIFANRNGKLTAKVCIGEECREETLKSGSSTVSVNSTEIITLSATIKAEGRRDILEIETVSNNYGLFTTATARFVISDINGFTSLAASTNEYVGFSLSDPAFQLYDIGWKSQSYFSECWDSYPTVKCSFRAAYLGGIVPKGESTRPWVGLSSWFDDKSCSPQYWYNGEDACGSGSGYKECYADDYYKFTTGGLHGTSENQTVDDVSKVVETNMAMARIQNCDAAYLSDEDRALLYLESPRCGEFWVGELSNCNKNVLFFSGSRSINTHSGSTAASEISNDELFSLTSNEVANLRSAVIKISLDNPDGSELEIYLRSQTEPGYYGSTPVFSTSAVSTAKYIITINVEDLAAEAGFDPEHVTGVVIRNLGTQPVSIKEIRSVCDYVTSIQCKNVEFTGGKFKVNAVVKHAEEVKSYSIAGTENDASNMSLSKSFDCSSAECPTGDADGRIYLESNAYNPYATAFDAEKSYVFTVHMIGEDNADVEGSPCMTTPVFKLQPVSGECKWSTTNDKPSVQQGKGLPDFQYRLADCAGGNCAWEIYLGDTKIYGDDTTGIGEVAGYTSLPSDVRNGYNTEDDKLDPGDYTIYFKNKASATTKFNECSKTFTVVEAGSGTGNLTCSMPSEVLPGAQINSISIFSSLEAQNFDVYFDNEKKYSNLWVNNGQNSFNYVNAPTDYKTYTYKITKSGKEEAECSGTVAVVNPLQCNIKNEVKVGVQNVFEVSASSGSNCSNCSYTNVSCTQCSGLGVMNQNFTMNNSTPLELSVTCQCNNISVSCSRTAVAEVVAPDVDCSGTYNAEPGTGTTISFTPSKLTGCEGGCTYWVNNPDGTKITPSTDGTITSATSISFHGEARSNTNTYTLYVHNSKGDDNCSITVDYKVPSYSCPTTAINAEPGTQITVTPVLGNPSYCATNGCKYSISGGKFSDESTSGTGFKSGSLAKKIVDNSDPITSPKSYSLTLSNDAGDGTACDIDVNYMKPTFTCPGNMEKQLNAEVELDLSTVPYCANGCSYEITGGTFTDNSTSGSGYTGGKITKKIKGESTESTGDGTTYTLKLRNPAGYDTENCSFKIKYLKNTCQEIVANFNTTNYTVTGTLKNGCAVIKTNRICTGGMQIELQPCNGKTGSWNGHAFTLNNNNNGWYQFNANPDPKMTNLLEMPDCPTATINKVYLDGCADYTPSISCAALSTSKTKGSDVVISPTVTNCDNTNKCSYTITGAGTNINHTTKNWISGSNMDQLAVVNETGEKTYKLKVANAYAESAECSFTINYTEPVTGPVELEITDGNNFPGEYNDVPSGTCFTLTGIWNNQYHSPDAYFYCQHSQNGMSYYKSGNTPTHDGNNNFRINTGNKVTYTTTKKTFVESICVTSDDGNNITKCGFGS